MPTKSDAKKLAEHFFSVRERSFLQNLALRRTTCSLPPLLDVQRGVRKGERGGKINILFTFA